MGATRREILAGLTAGGVASRAAAQEATMIVPFFIGDHSDRADVRFARPNTQIYDAHVVALYQWVCARYLVGVKAAGTKASAVKLGSRPNFRKNYVGFPNPVPSRNNWGSIIEIRNSPYISI
jgi:hypothetical protein